MQGCVSVGHVNQVLDFNTLKPELASQPREEEGAQEREQTLVGSLRNII